MSRAKFIALLGAPASGKSSLAFRLSQETGIILASKDSFKIVAFEAWGFRSEQEKKFLGKLAENKYFEFVKSIVDERKDLIVEGYFNHTRIYDIPNESDSNYSVYRIFCHAAPAVLADRYNKRIKSSERHPSLSIRNCYPFVEGVSEFQSPVSVEFVERSQALIPKPSTGKILTVDTTNLHRDFDSIYKRILNFCDMERRL